MMWKPTPRGVLGSVRMFGLCDRSVFHRREYICCLPARRDPNIVQDIIGVVLIGEAFVTLIFSVVILVIFIELGREVDVWAFFVHESFQILQD